MLHFEDFKGYVDDRFFSHIKEYMDSIDASVKERISKSQRAMEGDGCLLSPGSKMKVVQEQWSMASKLKE